MQNVEEALESIRELAGLPDLKLDGDGQVELIFDGETRIALAKIDDANFELYTEIEHLGGNLSRDVLIRLLTANYLGEATGPGRLALDPRDNCVSYGQRVDVRLLDERRLEAVFSGFLRHAAFLRSDEAAELIRGAGRSGGPGLSSDAFMMRV